MLISSTCISQGNVATCFGCGGNFNDSFVTNCLQNVSVKKFGKSVKNWQRYWYSSVYYFFEAVYIQR